MQTRDEVGGFHNGREFPQPLECLYQDMQTQEKKVFYCFYEITLREKSKSLLFRALIKREILTSREVLHTKLVRVFSPCFPKRCVPKYGFFSLKISAQAKNN